MSHRDVGNKATPSKSPHNPPLEDEELFGGGGGGGSSGGAGVGLGHHDEDHDEDEEGADDKYEMYDELGRTPPRTRMNKNRKWKDNKKHMGELEQ